MQIARLRFALFALPVTVILAGCSTEVALRGNLPRSYQIAEIHPGKTTAEEVVKILGSPSSAGVFDRRHWYYISRRTSRTAFFTPKVLSQDVYIVDFNDKGVVRSIEHKNLKNAKELTPASGMTPAPGQRLTFLQQLIGNIGRFNGVSEKSSGP
jgi:outer membrane protein assembly factor BamE (lipoprotein component of BamABCDE complex)